MALNGKFDSLKGTTYPSFKIGVKGVALSSRAVIDNQSGDVIKKYLIVNDEVGVNSERIVPTFSTAQENGNYDAFIATSNITALEHNAVNGVLTITLTNGTTISVNETAIAFSGTAPSANQIAVFNDVNGNIKTSGKTIASSVTTTTQNNQTVVTNGDDVATIGAVVNYVGTLSAALATRLNGGTSQQQSGGQ